MQYKNRKCGNPLVRTKPDRWWITRPAIAAIAIFALQSAVAGPESGNRGIIQRFATQFYTDRDVSGAFNSFVSADYIQHNPGLPDGPAAAVTALSPMFHKAGSQFDIKHILVDGDMALIHLLGKGDPESPGGAVADLYRLSSGHVVEHWDVIQAVPPGSSPLASQPYEPSKIDQTAQNRAIMRQFANELYEKKQVASTYQKFVAADFVDHSPGRAGNRDSAIAALVPLFATPDATFVVHHLLVDNDFAAVHYRGQLGPKSHAVAVVEIFRLRGGKIVEHWDTFQSIPDTSHNSHPMF
jgi:predicted SnoaL-like aldol condensation-catalyzing enzyme